MTAMPDGPAGPPPESAGSERAAALLRHAQNVADELHARAVEEAEAHTAESRRLRDEAERLHEEATRSRDRARRLLDDTSADAQQIVGERGHDVRVLHPRARTLDGHHPQRLAERLANHFPRGGDLRCRRRVGVQATLGEPYTPDVG